MISTKEDLKKEAEVLYRMQNTFTDIGFINRVVTIAELYAQQQEVSPADFTELIREADRIFETIGGSTNHYVRDCLLPLMEEKGYELIKKRR